jgi:hypothetical protein
MTDLTDLKEELILWAGCFIAFMVGFAVAYPIGYAIGLAIKQALGWS